MTSTTPTIQSASLHFREGNSDKEYHAAIEPSNKATPPEKTDQMEAIQNKRLSKLKIHASKKMMHQ